MPAEIHLIRISSKYKNYYQSSRDKRIQQQLHARTCKEFQSFCIFTFFYTHKKKVLDSWKFSTSGFRWFLHVLRCPEHDLIIFRKCLSVCVSLSVCLTVGLPVLFCGGCILRTNGRKMMKLNIQLLLYGT